MIKKIAWKSYHEISNAEFVWDKNSLSQTDTVNGVPCLIHIVGESISKMKNGKAGRKITDLVRSV